MQMDKTQIPQTFRIVRSLVGMFVETSGFLYTWSSSGFHLPYAGDHQLRVEFEVSMVVLLHGDHLIRENSTKALQDAAPRGGSMDTREAGGNAAIPDSRWSQSQHHRLDFLIVLYQEWTKTLRS